jgi:hypothetical protein
VKTTEKSIRDFWWGDDENGRKVHWSAWDNLTKPKSKGGLGFRDMQLFNQALLARHPTSLCARVLKAKYYPHGDIRDTVFESDPSLVRKGVEFGLDLLKKGLINHIGNRNMTQITRDQRVPRDSGLKITVMKKNTRRRWVNELINPESRTWKVDLIRELFYEHDTEAILNIGIPKKKSEDRVAWHHEPNRIFRVKSAYRLALSLNHVNRDDSSCSTQPDGDRTI